MRALDYFQAVNAPRDWRFAEAIDIVRTSRRSDGRWSLENYYKGKSYFELERLGMPSRWNTLRALQVLKWWELGAPHEEVNPIEAGSGLQLPWPSLSLGTKQLKPD